MLGVICTLIAVGYVSVVLRYSEKWGGYSQSSGEGILCFAAEIRTRSAGDCLPPGLLIGKNEWLP